MESPKTLQQAIQFFGEYENCRQFMISLRWADGKVRCPHCESDKEPALKKRGSIAVTGITLGTNSR
jgi:Transposase zinc-ribbon domain